MNEKVREDKNEIPRQTIQTPYNSGFRQNIETSSAPRLYFEPSTGQVIDRVTGQAFLLQPIVNSRY